MVKSKSNEIEAIPHLLDILDLEGIVVTIDAAGTQKAIAKQIVANKADYVLALKKNHPKLHDAAGGRINSPPHGHLRRHVIHGPVGVEDERCRVTWGIQTPRSLRNIVWLGGFVLFTLGGLSY